LELGAGEGRRRLRRKSWGAGDARAGRALLAVSLRRAARALHAVSLRRALLHRPTPAASNALLTAYARCGDLAAALALFAATPPELRDAVSYNSLISALCLLRL
jgi:hypothetical protein